MCADCLRIVCGLPALVKTAVFYISGCVGVGSGMEMQTHTHAHSQKRGADAEERQ